jgi:hypothetical protein
MSEIHQWIRSRGSITDPELNALLRNSALEQPYRTRGSWFKELELALGIYAGPLAVRAARVRTVLEDLLISLTQEGLVRRRP